jgi:hypothetical protein
MKKIEEEWKTIEGFPDYEISNFGRCRTINNYQLLKKIKASNNCYTYRFRYTKKEGIAYKRKYTSTGILVARAFVENPNGYKNITYLDGDSSNNFFTNIQWVKSHNDIGAIRKKIEMRIIPKEEQLKNLREKIEMAERFEKALQEGTEQEFIYGEIKELCCRKVDHKYGLKNSDFKEEMTLYIVELILDRVSRGCALVSYEYTINMEMAKFYKKYKEQLKTVEFDERRM